MKDKPLSHYLALIDGAMKKYDWDKAKHLGETILKKISRLTYSPDDEYLLYKQLALTYHNAGDYGRSLEMLYKAALVVRKHALPPACLANIHLIMGNNFLNIRSIDQALKYLYLAEQYYREYGYRDRMMNEHKHFRVLICLGYCYLYKNELGRVREIIEEKVPPYQPFGPPGFFEAESNHLRGEYLLLIKRYAEARAAFRKCITAGERINYPLWPIEAKIHLAMIDLVEGEINHAVQTLSAILKEARHLKFNELVGEIGLLLSKSYTLQGRPDKAAAIEQRIKSSISRMDTVWLYERTREFDRLYRQIGPAMTGAKAGPPEDGRPRILVDALERRYRDIDKNIIIGNSFPMQEVWHLVEKVAPTDLPVLLQGETGTGKELMAQAIHQNSLRLNKTCLAFNCGAIPETLIESHLFGHNKGAFTGAGEDKKGYIELASGGTLFIDEIGDMSPGMQQKLLRVMEEKLVWRLGAQKPIPVNTRFFFASNRDMEQMVKSKLFREDLFYRINTITITLPPLRDRKDDIPLLIQHFFTRYSPKTQDAKRITPDALALLVAYPWPGNVRELENEIKRLCTLHPNAEIITPAMLSELIRNTPLAASSSFKSGKPLKELRNELEKEIIRKALSESNDNITQTAGQLGCDRSTLSKRMKQLKIKGSSGGQGAIPPPHSPYTPSS